MDYPAKIILFGEYGIILNSKALAIPYPRYTGRFRIPESSTDKLSVKENESNKALDKLNNYFKSNEHNFNFLRLDHFKSDIDKGLYFHSSIPSGSGLGSSGALTAALYDRYSAVNHGNDFELIKTELAAIESCFHGISSGIDPFISWMNKPLLLDNQLKMDVTTMLSQFFNTYTLFLIHSSSPGNTGTLVNLFMEKYQQSGFKAKIDQEYIPLINQTIDAILAADFSTFEAFMTRYSQFQLSYFQEMIPAKMINYFKYGIESHDFYLKICGSGGGGFTLAIARDREKAEGYFNLNHLDYTIV